MIYESIFISCQLCRIYYEQVRQQLTRLKVCHLRQGRSYPRKCSIMQARVVKRPYSRFAIKPSIVRVLIIRAGLMMPIKISYDSVSPVGNFISLTFFICLSLPLFVLAHFLSLVTFVHSLKIKPFLHIYQNNHVPYSSRHNSYTSWNQRR